MVTLNQRIKTNRIQKFRRTRVLDLAGSPQKKVIVTRLGIQKPKKPNSARRKILKVYIPSIKKHAFCYIPAAGHSLQKFSRVLMRGGHRRDLPGMKYCGIRGVYDFLPPPFRKTARSKYGLRNFAI